MPNRFINQNLEFEQAVKNIIRQSFPAAATPFVLQTKAAQDFTGGATAIPVVNLDRSTNRGYFVWMLRWGSSRPVGP